MPLELLKNCPVCQSSSFSNFLNVEDYTVSHQEFTLQQCNSCNFLFTNPRPPANEIGEYYQSEDYISHHDESTTVMSKIYKSVRDYTITGKIRLINSVVPMKGALLDVGCGTGNFVSACKENGWQVTGTEPDPGARGVAAKRVGESIYDSINDPAIRTRSFDIISLWHVLEHVHLLNETLSWLADHLNPGGKIIIAVPNYESSDAKKFGRFWAAYDVPRHLYHFSKGSMKQLTSNHNLSIIDILPMWFDSFYVGMLSTRYKSKNVNLFESLKTGLISNVKGYSSKSESTNTSSLIYVITKK